jgi:hypothetical protein
MGETRRVTQEEHDLVSLWEHRPRVEGGIPARH